MENELTNVQAEQTLLGAILINNEIMLHIGSLRIEHFSDPLHGRIFAVLSANWDENLKSDPIALKYIFDNDEALVDIGGGAYLAKLAAHSTCVIDVKDYANVIIDLASRRRVKDTLLKAMEHIRNPATDINDAAMALSSHLAHAVSQSETDLFHDNVQVTEEILEDMKRDVPAYNTGYSKLDDAMAGGLYPGKSYGFAARKKVGKTILAGCISHNLNERGIKHLFICGEMSPAEVQKRTLGRILRVNAGAFYQSNSAFMQRVAEAARTNKRNVIYKNAPGLTFEDLKRYVLLARLQKKITGFILDYWQLVGGKPNGKSTAEHLDEVAQWIADTCRKYDLWSIVMAQINQEGNTRGGEGIRLAFDQVYVLRAPEDDAGQSVRWLEMSDTRYTAWKSVGSERNPGLYMSEFGPHFSETSDVLEDLGL